MLDDAAPVTCFSIAPGHPCLPGHFPGRPLVPAVVMVEQVLAILEARHGSLGPIRLPRVKFLRPLLPGQTAQVELQGAPPRWRFRILRDGEVLASGDIVQA